jgi:uncharacterized protein (TIGR02118 family)
MISAASSAMLYFHLRARLRETHMIAITVGYKSTTKMNKDYYFGTHVPLIENALTKWGLKATEARNITGTPSGEPPPYQMITTLYFDDLPAFSTAMSTDDGRAVLADIKNFYDGMPDFMIGET